MTSPQRSDAVLPFVYVVGDSISIQYGPFLEEALTGKFRYARKSGETEALLNLDVPSGANAGDSAQVLKFLEIMLKVPGFDPDVLLLNCGLHDIKRDPASGTTQVSLDEYRENLRWIVALCAEKSLRLVWVRSTPVVDKIHNSRMSEFHRFAEDLQACNACADEVMARAGVSVIDLHAFTCGLGDAAGIFCDHVHFSEPVRRGQAAFLAEALERLVLRAAP